MSRAQVFWVLHTVERKFFCFAYGAECSDLFLREEIVGKVGTQLVVRNLFLCGMTLLGVL